MYSYEIKPELQRILKKLFKKDKKIYEAVINKIEEIKESDFYFCFSSKIKDFCDTRN